MITKEKLIDKLKEVKEDIGAARRGIDDRNANAAALRGIVSAQAGLLDCFVGMVQLGLFDQELESEPEPEPEPDNEFDVDTLEESELEGLKQVYQSKPAAKKAAKKKR